MGGGQAHVAPRAPPRQHAQHTDQPSPLPTSVISAVTHNARSLRRMIHKGSPAYGAMRPCIHASTPLATQPVQPPGRPEFTGE